MSSHLVHVILNHPIAGKAFRCAFFPSCKSLEDRIKLRERHQVGLLVLKELWVMGKVGSTHRQRVVDSVNNNEKLIDAIVNLIDTQSLLPLYGKKCHTMVYVMQLIHAIGAKNTPFSSMLGGSGALEVMWDTWKLLQHLGNQISPQYATYVMGALFAACGGENVSLNHKWLMERCAEVDEFFLRHEKLELERKRREMDAERKMQLARERERKEQQHHEKQKRQHEQQQRELAYRRQQELQQQHHRNRHQQQLQQPQQYVQHGGMYQGPGRPQ